MRYWKFRHEHFVEETYFFHCVTCDDRSKRFSSFFFLYSPKSPWIRGIIQSIKTFPRRPRRNFKPVELSSSLLVAGVQTGISSTDIYSIRKKISEKTTNYFPLFPYRTTLYSLLFSFLQALSFTCFYILMYSFTNETKTSLLFLAENKIVMIIRFLLFGRVICNFSVIFNRN